MEISKEQITHSIKNEIPAHFSNVFPNSYHWDNFINFINYAIKQNNPEAATTNFKETIGYVNFWQKLTLTLDNISNTYFPEIEERNIFLESLANKKALGRFGALSLTDSEPTTGKHSDPVTVMYWNCIGNVEWTVFTENKNYSFVLQPGDVILVPANMLHEVKSLGPRAAISFMFES
jgi:hypothetical protein